jgi:hypothetical protein
LLKIARGKVLKLFLEDSPELVICDVLVVMFVNLGCYVLFKVVRRGIFGVDSVSESRDSLSLFRVYVSGFEE